MLITVVENDKLEPWQLKLKFEKKNDFQRTYTPWLLSTGSEEP